MVVAAAAVAVVVLAAVAVETGRESHLYRFPDIHNRTRKKTLHIPEYCEGRTTTHTDRCQKWQSLGC